MDTPQLYFTFKTWTIKVCLQVNGKASQDVLIVYAYVCVTSVSGKLM